MADFAEKGIVYLVGAGPGDPGLFTLRGATLLEQADVVVYDYLASRRLLSYCPRAELIYAGKQSSSHTLTQDQINELLIEKARLGKRIVRLKGGDPFVFGRGGEECLALQRAGIRFEVVPGITSAIAAAAYAGIPITFREYNSSLTLITGHESTDEPSDIDWPGIAKLPCIAFYMGVAALENICLRLMENGMHGETPAATVQWGTTPRQRTVVATLATLAQAVVEQNISSPAITVIGRMVSLRPMLNWFENRPLFGKRIVVTRTRQQASELSQRLEELGADVIEAPTIELAPPEDWADVDAALNSAAKYDWIIFTSANGVSAVKNRLFQIGLDARALGNAQIACIGPATKRAVENELCRKVDLCPEKFVAEALGDAMISQNAVKNRRFLLLRADIARPVLREQLQKSDAAEVADIAVYQTRMVASLPGNLKTRIEAGEINWITFASSSAVKNFLHLLGVENCHLLPHVKLAAIGPITAATLKENGLQPSVVADEFTIDGLVAGILGAT